MLGGYACATVEHVSKILAPHPRRAMLRLGALVLAAGAASRFSDQPGAKLIAELRGRPVLAHVLEAVRAYGPALTVVVLGHGRGAIESAIDWTDELRVVNPAPERGLASSLQVGMAAARSANAAPAGHGLDGLFIVLGDQPMLRPQTLVALATAAAASAEASGRATSGRAPTRATIFVPRYASASDADQGPRNPVLLLRPAWPLIDRLVGDRGLAQSVADLGEAVVDVPVPGSQPDVDTRGDLAELERRLRPSQSSSG